MGNKTESAAEFAATRATGTTAPAQSSSSPVHQPELTTIDLRNPVVAAILGWLIPGAGHLYQGRRLKGWLYLVCILGTYIVGLWLGGGHCVYASWTPEDRRWQFVCQAGVGLPVLPAIVQNRRVMANQPPLLAPVLAPPIQPVIPGDRDELASWYHDFNWRYDVGTLYTIIAGLLNILAIFDAYSGPLVVPAPTRSEDEEPQT